MDYSKHTEGTTSVKVHHAPGGKSNFSLSWNEPEPAPKKNVPAPAQQPIVSQPQPKVETKPQHQQNANNEGAKTSVKVHNPPGGKSNFTLG